MDKERLEKIKINSKDACQYMKKVEKEYLYGQTVKDKNDFIREFSINHSEEEIELLINELNSIKDGGLVFFNGYSGTFIPLLVSMFAFIGSFISAFFNFYNSLILKIIDLLIKKKDNQEIRSTLEEGISMYEGLWWRMGLVFILSLIFFGTWLLYNTIRYKEKLKYIYFLNSAKFLKTQKHKILEDNNCSTNF
ncbi:hypothetical protein [Parageobacillus sp. KH3-4]|uniref:hypothetical protein n=1 Tax=Parageobacillus sp. KH3-4 TaxID=2916802 RepID=UPI001FCB8D02|nr:hypothetical protein [Parageobacillus sp. KH3-4]BDG46400.1 hypothetical protein PspKH34_09610 [Parageobacillus sp. KH3-4]